MARFSLETPSRKSTEASALLHALAQSDAASLPQRLQPLLLSHDYASVLSDILRLAVADPSCRLPCLRWMETLWCGPAVQDGGLAQAIRDAEPLLGHWLETDSHPETRAAAGRLLAVAGGPGRANVLNQRLRLEKNPAVAAAILGAIHPLRMAAGDAQWRGVLAQFQTESNSAPVRLQAACCCLELDGAVPALLTILRQYLYCPRERTAAAAILVIAPYARLLPREEAVRLWLDLLAAASEFDGAADLACHLLRAACEDRREGWSTVRLSSILAPGAPAGPARFRRLWTGAYHRLTGRMLPLASGERPARHYPEVTAFPPSVDPAEPCQRAALSGLVSSEPLWQGHTDLWRHFGLPADRAALSALCCP